MAVCNQFRIKNLPRSRYSREQVWDIIYSKAKVISKSEDSIRIRYRWGLNMAKEWEVFLEYKRDTFDIVMENNDRPWSTYGCVGCWGGREFLTKIEKEIRSI